MVTRHYYLHLTHQVLSILLMVGLSSQAFTQINELALALLVLRVGTNDHDPTTAADDTALVTHFLNRCSNFHG